MTKRIGLLMACLAATLLPTTAQVPAIDPIGVYGWVYSVVPEPSPEKPERVQIWGIFSVAASGENADYQSPERGYLYFSLPTANQSEALRDWEELRGVPGNGGLWSFARRGGRIRVRAADENPEQPDAYIPGNGVAPSHYKASEGARMMGAISHEGPSISYALVDSVVLEPNEVAPDRIQIWGAFAMAKAPTVPYRASDVGFLPLQRGYLYLTIPPGRNTAAILREWIELRSLAGTRRLAGLNLRGARVRRADEAASSPDAYGFTEFFVLRTDTEYRPVRALLDLR